MKHNFSDTLSCAFKSIIVNRNTQGPAQKLLARSQLATRDGLLDRTGPKVLLGPAAVLRFAVSSRVTCFLVPATTAAVTLQTVSGPSAAAPADFEQVARTADWSSIKQSQDAKLKVRRAMNRANAAIQHRRMTPKWHSSAAIKQGSAQDCQQTANTRQTRTVTLEQNGLDGDPRQDKFEIGLGDHRTR